MEFGLNDSLKSRAFGTKKDVISKMDKIDKIESEGGRYYVRDPNGNINEWGAILQHQAEAFKKQDDEIRMKKEAEK